MAFEKGEYNSLYQKLLIIFVLLTIILIIFLTYYFFFYETSCGKEDCFKKAFDKCKKVNFIKEDEQASWLYQIQGKSVVKSKCDVKITILGLKQGTIDNQNLEGKSMNCDVIKENALIPEGDLTSCTGELKEEMQEIIIQRMHNYIIQNVGKIEEEFKNLG